MIELSEKCAQLQGLVGDVILLDRQANLESWRTVRPAQRGKPLTQPAGAGEKIDHGNGSNGSHSRAGSIGQRHGQSKTTPQKQDYVDFAFRPLFRSQTVFWGAFRSGIPILGRQKGDFTGKKAKIAPNTRQSLTNPAANASEVCQN